MRTSKPGVSLTSGNLLNSPAQTLVNTVNCVGIMGKGIALAFKKRYPEMYKDYVARCDRGEVRLGQPYVFQAADHLIINFPTKDHWRSVSRLEDIVSGLEYLHHHVQQWGVTSMAVPPLGCGNGQLEWDVVGPTLVRYLDGLSIPVELYPPHGESSQLALLEASVTNPTPRFVEPEWVAFTALLAELEREPYRWPVGRIFLQKIAYFADRAGLPTGLTWEQSSYGPYTPSLKTVTARLQNNGLIEEHRHGQMIEVRVGTTYRDALEAHREYIAQHRDALRRTLNLVARLDTRRAEVAATVHFAAERLAEMKGTAPMASDVVAAVQAWKINRKPPLTLDEILTAMITLGSQGWLKVIPDEPLLSALDFLEPAAS
jgi:uncharacterized protein YwgA/O-acetyl-ADP-ribose deacetylase (regulator of RNase III)